MTITKSVPQPIRKSRAIFYGWIVVACVGVILFMAFGSVYSFTTFFKSFQIEFQTTRSSTSLIFAIAGFIYFCLGAVSGPIADRIGAKWVLTFGVLVIGTGLLVASRATTVRQIYAIYGLGIGVGVGFVYVPAVGVVQRWFIRKRGLASGIAVTGIGLGTLCMPPASAALIYWSDWRTAYLLMGLFVFVFGIIAALLIIETPEKLGLQPDGDSVITDTISTMEEPPSAGAALCSQGISVKDALQTRPFWLLYFGIFCTSLGLFIPFVHMVPFSNDLGLPTATGVTLFSLIGFGSTVGRFLVGGIADRLGRRQSLSGMYAGFAAMFLWWLFADSVWELAVFTLLFGTCYGGFVALLPALTADYFSGPNMSGIIGTLYTSVAVGNLCGPTLAGYMFDLKQSYTIPIIASTFFALCSAGSALLLKDPLKWRASFLLSAK
jgi:MFS family permease